MPYVGNGETLWMNGIYDSVCAILIFPMLVYLGASGKTTDKHSARICKFLGDISYPCIWYITLLYTCIWVGEEGEPYICRGMAGGIGLGSRKYCAGLYQFEDIRRACPQVPDQTFLAGT